MQVGDARSFNLARITGNDGCPFFFRLYHPAGDNGVRIRRIPPKDEQAFSVFNLHNGVAHCAIADRLLQTCNGWAVSDPRAAVDIIGAESRAGEFLHYVVGFVAGGTGRTGYHDGAKEPP